MKLNIRAKIILIGAGLSFLLMLVALIFSFSVYRTKAKETLSESVDNCINQLDLYFKDEDSLDQLNNLSDAVMTPYRNDPDEPEFKDVDEKYLYYNKKYGFYKNSNQGMLGLALPTLQLRSSYYEFSSILASSISALGSQNSFFAYRDDERSRLVYVIDSIYYLDDKYDENSRFPGAYYTLSLGDGELDDIGNYQSVSLSGRTYRYLDIIRKTPTEEGVYSEYLGSIFVEFDEHAFDKSLNDFLLTEFIAFVLATVFLIIAYAILVHFALVKNIKRLDDTARNFTEKVLSGDSLNVLDPNVKTKDELGKLSRSFVTLEEEIINYTDKIATDAREKEKMNAELSIATQIQLEELPERAFLDKNVKINASITSAKEVGGDFYDYFYVDQNRVTTVIADVSGKGIPAALFMMKAKGLLKNKIIAVENLSQALFEVNNELIENNKAGLFVTAFVAVINVKTGEMDCISAGHEKPYLIENGKVEKLNINSNFVLGGFKNFKYTAEKVKLGKRKLFAFTDGLNESINAENQEYGYERVEASLSATDDLTLEDALVKVKNDLKDFVGQEEPFDDVTLIMVELNDGFEFSVKEPNYDAIEKITDNFNEYFSTIQNADLSRVDVILDEMINNYVSYENKKDFVLTVKANLVQNSLKLQFITNGKEFDPLSQEDKVFDGLSAGTSLGGYGITITKSLADEMTYKRIGDKNYLTIIKKVEIKG